MSTPDSVSTFVHYRLARLADIDDLMQLIALSVESIGSRYYSPEQLASSLEYVFGVDRQLIADGTYYVAERVREAQGTKESSDPRPEIIGCGGWSMRRRLFGKDSASWNGDPAEPLNPAIEPARIRAFFVHPDWARRGIARALLELSEQAARARGFRTFELAATLMGEPMYARCGFIELERIDYELPDGVHLPVVRMLKPLVPAGHSELHAV